MKKCFWIFNVKVGGGRAVIKQELFYRTQKDIILKYFQAILKRFCIYSEYTHTFPN